MATSKVILLEKPLLEREWTSVGRVEVLSLLKTEELAPLNRLRGALDIYIYIYIYIYLKRYTGIDRYPKYIVPLAKPVQSPVRYWLPWLHEYIKTYIQPKLMKPFLLDWRLGPRMRSEQDAWLSITGATNHQPLF